MTNKRNQYGVKDCIDTYLNINGKHYEQWSDCMTKEECEKEYPDYNFITRSFEKEGFVRVYKLL